MNQSYSPYALGDAEDFDAALVGQYINFFIIVIVFADPRWCLIFLESYSSGLPLKFFLHENYNIFNGIGVASTENKLLVMSTALLGSSGGY